MLGKRSIIIAVAAALMPVVVPVLATAEEGVAVDPAFQCVGDAPPRQTFDPYSPPCVPFFDGDNGGATASGVTADEIRVLVYLPGSLNYTGGSDPSNRGSPGGQIFDLGQSPQECRNSTDWNGGCDHLTVRGLRVWQSYLNQRFQSYDRNLRFFAQFTDGISPTPEAQRADWARALSMVDPFIVVPLTDPVDVDVEPFIRAAADAGRVVFSNDRLYADPLLDELAPHVWSWAPTIDVAAGNFAGQVCAQVVGQRATRTGVTTGDPVAAVFPGLPRRIGLLWTTSPDHRYFAHAADLVRDAVTGCGGQVVEEQTFTECCLAHDGGDIPDEALRAMREMRLAGVETILWPGGFNGNIPKAAAALNYEPEWVVLGDGALDNRTALTYSGGWAAFNGRAATVTHRVPERADQTPICEKAFREIDQTTPDSDLGYVCEYYRPLFLATMAIQVAGPSLSVEQVDKGLRAIPARQGSPGMAATSFTVDDRSYVDDATAEWFDATSGDRVGCYRSVDGAARHVAGDWPETNWGTSWSSTDACDTWGSSTRINLA